jgi:hypothetical protein
MRPTSFAFFLITLFLIAPLYAQSEQATVCFYYKRQNPVNPDAGYTFFIVNNKQASGQFVLRYAPKSKFPYIDLGRPISGVNDVEVAQMLSNRIASFFSDYDRRKLSTPLQFRDLIDIITDGSRVLKQVNLATYGVKDRVLAFDADAADANYMLLKEPNALEAGALYNLVVGSWKTNTAQLDYRERVLKSSVARDLLTSQTIQKAFEIELPSEPQKQELTAEIRALINKAEERATYALIVAALAVLATGFLGLIIFSELRKRVEQFNKFESRLKHLDIKINRPFYQQASEKDSSSEASSSRTTEYLLARLSALEQKLGVQSDNALTLHHETAKQIQSLAQQHWHTLQQSTVFSEQPELLGRLQIYFSELFAALPDLDNGLPLKTFIQKHIVPHIDRIDSLFQTEPDAALNTPEVVTNYFKDLMQLLDIKEIDIKQKVSKFDIEKHEKAGVILKTPLDSGTIIKVVRRGFIYNGTVRKAQVVKAE